jgi:hypothetical protein
MEVATVAVWAVAMEVEVPLEESQAAIADGTQTETEVTTEDGGIKLPTKFLHGLAMKRQNADVEWTKCTEAKVQRITNVLMIG